MHIIKGATVSKYCFVPYRGEFVTTLRTSCTTSTFSRYGCIDTSSSCASCVAAASDKLGLHGFTRTNRTAIDFCYPFFDTSMVLHKQKINNQKRSLAMPKRKYAKKKPWCSSKLTLNDTRAYTVAGVFFDQFPSRLNR